MWVRRGGRWTRLGGETSVYVAELEEHGDWDWRVDMVAKVYTSAGNQVYIYKCGAGSCLDFGEGIPGMLRGM